MRKFSLFAQAFSRKLESMPQRYVVLALIIPSLLVFAIVYSILSNMGSDGSKVQPQEGMISVVVAKEDIPQRTILRSSMLKVVELPASMVPSDAATSVQALVGKPTRIPMLQGDVLTERKVLTDVKMAGFTGAIPPECRAISVGINDITGVAGFARPGDYVDVMLINDTDKTRITGRILLQNILLLAINKSQDVPAVSTDGGTAAEGASKESLVTATLALSSQEALELAVMTKQGSLYLVLRPYKPQDQFVIDTDYSLPKPVEAPTREERPVAAAVPAAAAPASVPVRSQETPGPASDWGSVTVIKGTQSSLIGVNK